MINVWSLAQKWQLAKKCLYHPFGGMLAWKVANKHPQNCCHFWRNLPHRQGQSCRGQVQVAPIPLAAEGRTCLTKCLPGDKLYKDIVYCKEFGVKFKDIKKILTCLLLMLGCCHLPHLVQGWLCVYMNWYLHWHVSIVGMCLLSTAILISVALVHHPAII